MGISEHLALAIEGYINLILGSMLLLGLTYTYLSVRKLKNLRFMSKLLLMMLLISVTEIYSGILLISYINGAAWA